MVIRDRDLYLIFMHGNLINFTIDLRESRVMEFTIIGIIISIKA